MKGNKMAMIPLRERGFSEVALEDNSKDVAASWEKLAAALKDVSADKLNTTEIAHLIVDPDSQDFKYEVGKSASDIFYSAAKIDAISIWTGTIYNDKLLELICRLPDFHGKHVPDSLEQFFQQKGLI